MTSGRDTERLVAEYYATELPVRAPRHLVESVLADVAVTRQRRRRITGQPGKRSRTRVGGLLAAAALLLVGAFGWGSLTGQGPAIPTTAPTTDALAWSPAQLGRDWPAPLRPEPGGEPLVIEMALAPDAHWDPAEGLFEGHAHFDPVGDLSSGGPDWLDIREVTASSGSMRIFGVELAGILPRPLPDPAERWIAYGVVFDTDADGVPDEQLGVDNLPDGTHRAWRTLLGSGETQAKAGPPYGSVGGAAADGTDDGRYGVGRASLDTYYPGEEDSETARASFWYTVDPSARFYGWASLIEDGRVVATDFAPDRGWLIQAPQPGLTLVGPTWAVSSWTFGDVVTMMPENVTSMVTFRADGRVVTDAACSDQGSQLLEGDVLVEPDRIRITNLPRPDRLCRGMAEGVDVAILDVLSAPELEYTIDGAELELRSGTSSLRLRAEEATPPG